MHTKTFALMLCGALLFAPAARAQDVKQPEVVTLSQQAEESLIMRTAKESNLRAKPSTKSGLNALLIKGKKVKVLEKIDVDGETWARIRVVSNGQEGYILFSLLEEIPEPTPTPQPTATPEPKATATPEPAALEDVFETPLLARTVVRTNLRAAPDGKLIDAVSSDTHLSLLGQLEGEEGKLWYHVKEESGREGYMLAELLYLVRPAVLTEISESEVRERFPVLSCDPLEDARDADLPAYSDKELSGYSTLTVGTRSKDVLALKRRLYKMGYFTKPNENSNYTQSTAEVIERFQEDVNLPVTGVADPLTQAALFDDRTAKREGSAQEPKYLQNKEADLYIQKTDVTSYNYHGSLQLSVRNNSGKKLTAFSIKVIPYWSDGTPADMAETFAEEIERSWPIRSISIADGNSYSDFYTNNKLDDGIWPHHFLISKETYFPGAQLAITWYRVGGKTVYVDDDQMIFINAGTGAGDSLINTLPISLTAAESANCGWSMGLVTRYVLPVYQTHYNLPQGAWVKSVESMSPAEEAGLQPGDIIVGISEQTILGDATLRKARGQIAPGESAKLYFWREGVYYTTDLVRPED